MSLAGELAGGADGFCAASSAWRKMTGGCRRSGGNCAASSICSFGSREGEETDAASDDGRARFVATAAADDEQDIDGPERDCALDDERDGPADLELADLALLVWTALSTISWTI